MQKGKDNEPEPAFWATRDVASFLKGKLGRRRRSRAVKAIRKKTVCSGKWGGSFTSSRFAPVLWGLRGTGGKVA